MKTHTIKKNTDKETKTINISTMLPIIIEREQIII